MRSARLTAGLRGTVVTHRDLQVRSDSPIRAAHRPTQVDRPQRRDLVVHYGLCRREIRGLVQQWLAAQDTGDVAGLADGSRSGLAVA